MRAAVLGIVLMVSAVQLVAQQDSMWTCGGLSSIMDFRSPDTVISPYIRPQERLMYTSLSLSTIYMPDDTVLYISNGIDIANTKRELVQGDENLVDAIFRRENSGGVAAINYTLLLPKNKKQFYTINRSGDGSIRDPYHNIADHKTYYGVVDIADTTGGKVILSKVSLKDEIT